MHVVVVGLNHRTAPIDVRERLAFRAEAIPSVLAQLRRELGLTEAAILSTCNRVEVYGAVAETADVVARLESFLSRHGAVDLEALRPRLYGFQEPQSILHLFRVASGLDSMVLGEGEIVHQVKHAYEMANRSGATGKALNGCFQRALNAAKAVRSQTALGQGATSIGSVSVELAEKIFGRLTGAVVVLVGAGKVGELTLERLNTRGIDAVRIVNRSAERAAALSGRYGAQALALSELPQQLLDADILITSTTAPRYLADRTMLSEAMRWRHQRPLCIVDLGVPRNVEPSCGSIENVYLFNVDDLQGLVEQSRKAREEVAAEAAAIVARKVEHVLAWWSKEMVGCAALSSAPAEVL